jgi:hypothetical protein
MSVLWSFMGHSEIRNLLISGELAVARTRDPRFKSAEKNTEQQLIIQMVSGLFRQKSELPTSAKYYQGTPPWRPPKFPHLERWSGRLIRGAGRRDVMLLSHQHEGGRSERLDITSTHHHRDAAQLRRGTAGDRAAYRGGSQDHPALRASGPVARGGLRR